MSSPVRRILNVVAGLIVASFLGIQGAQAQAWWDSYRHGPREVEDGFLPTPSIASSLPSKGDPGGYRKWLGEHGIVYGLEYTNDILSNVRGGTKSGTIDQGKLQGIVTVDFDKLAGWDGLTFFANAFQIHNTGRFRRDYVGGITNGGSCVEFPLMFTGHKGPLNRAARRDKVKSGSPWNLLSKMRVDVAAILFLTWIVRTHAEPATLDPVDASFAYPNAQFSQSVGGNQQSLAGILQKDAPAYIRRTTQDLRRSAAAAAMQENQPVVFLTNLIQQESSFQRSAVSRAGAVGIAQFMPKLAAWRGLENPFEPESALIEAARYLTELRIEFGNLGLAAAAYNAGPSRLRDYLQQRRGLPAETQHYVLAVTRL